MDGDPLAKAMDRIRLIGRLFFILSGVNKLYQMPFSNVYPAYIKKVERKGHSVAELNEVIRWLTGYDEKTLKRHIKHESTLTDFFEGAKINKNASLITGSICGMKIQEIEDPLMLKIRYLDKLVDEIAKGRPMEKILRTGV
jgi:hypothetical protein